MKLSGFLYYLSPMFSIRWMLDFFKPKPVEIVDVNYNAVIRIPKDQMKPNSEMKDGILPRHCLRCASTLEGQFCRQCGFRDVGYHTVIAKHKDCNAKAEIHPFYDDLNYDVRLSQPFCPECGRKVILKPLALAYYLYVKASTPKANKDTKD